MSGKMSLRAVVSAVSAFAVLPLAATAAMANPGAAVPLVPDAVEVMEVAGVDLCPEVVVLAARGSEQNSGLEPTRYSPRSPWVSNGFEGETLRAFLLFAEQRHLERTGESLMADVAVLSLDEAVYPAALPLPALAEAGEELSPGETARRLGGVLNETPAHQIARHAGTQFVASVETAHDGISTLTEEYEEVTGCRPGYLLLGYSQGALVLTLQEEWLHEAGQLAGAVYLGNPLLAPDDPGIITHPVRGGVLRSVPAPLRPGAQTANRLNHCLPGDFVCDVDVDSVSTALTARGGPHGEYFLSGTPSEEEAAVADQFASWVKGYTSHP